MTAQLTAAGLANLTSAWAAYASLPKFLQWGTGSGAAKTANAVTTTGTTEARTTGTVSQQTTTYTNDTYQVAGTITSAEVSTLAVTEVGVFDAAGTGSPPTGGNMDIYGDFAVINLSDGDSINFTVKVQFS
jgi:hypothetical protein